MGGVRVVYNHLPGAPARLRRALSDELRAIGEDIQQDDRAGAPVKTGALSRSIQVETGGGRTVKVTIYSDLYYAQFQEFGTRYIAPRLFMTRAYQRHRARIESRIAAKVVPAVMG